MRCPNSEARLSGIKRQADVLFILLGGMSPVGRWQYLGFAWLGDNEDLMSWVEGRPIRGIYVRDNDE